ncbi:hypothetical protein PMKS-003869 [Pichia membranifaciens]|uniref:Uncharacterized protein n=1 Tax=Pichia membranifaciens TaxID=4926 RepID=A0A1Q2YLD0_9ASCO|nr:hypothetical protein PMKS-003869 [Pichia membranifaciens]
MSARCKGPKGPLVGAQHQQTPAVPSGFVDSERTALLPELDLAWVVAEECTPGHIASFGQLWPQDDVGEDFGQCKLCENGASDPIELEDQRTPELAVPGRQ